MPERTDGPRISVNKLGEYMTAGPNRRRRIVRDQRDPKPFIVAMYNEARAAIVRHLLARQEDDGIIVEAIDGLSRVAGDDEWKARAAAVSIEALEAYLDMDAEVIDEAVDVTDPEGADRRLEFAGVEVSVNPDVLLTTFDRDGRPRVGGVKVYIGKTISLDADAGDYVSTVVRRWVDTYLADERRRTERRLCRVIDVFGNRVFQAPQAYKRRMDNVSAACEEIALRWSAV